MDKKKLTERDICTKYINPALQNAGWDMHSQVREEVSFTAGLQRYHSFLHPSWAQLNVRFARRGVSCHGV